MVAPRRHGSGSSSRVANSTARHRRSRSGSPKTDRAQPSFGYETIVQLNRHSLIAWPTPSARSAIRVRPTRSPSSPSKRSGSGFPVISIVLPGSRRGPRAAGASPAACSRAPRPGRARSARASRAGRGSRRDVRRAAFHPSATIARTSGACSISPRTLSCWPGWRLTPTAHREAGVGGETIFWVHSSSQSDRARLVGDVGRGAPRSLVARPPTGEKTSHTRVAPVTDTCAFPG